MGFLVLTGQMFGAIVLFIGMNWLGRHASDLGYQSVTLFEQKSESIALNFLLRSVSPTVFIIIISVLLMSSGLGQYSRYTFGVIVFYYVIRLGYIFVTDKQEIVNWNKVVIQIIVGLGIGWWTFNSLILPQQNLLPDVQNMGTELWVMIALFLYAVINKIETPSGPSNRRKNSYIRKRLQDTKDRYGDIISSELDPVLQLTVYSIIIYENYNRPPLVRSLERLLSPKFSKTLGVMQVTTDRKITDWESVQIGIERIKASKAALFEAKNDISEWTMVTEILADYNQDDAYVDDVTEVMRIIARRIDRTFKPVWDNL